MSNTGIFLVLCFLATTVNSQYQNIGWRNNSSNSSNHRNQTLPKATGICVLEVPTRDLLSETERHGVIPQGNGSRPGYSKIQVCCSGYQRIPHTHYRCEPICENGCVNGNCTAPNKCVCYPDFILDLGGNCVPTCPRACLNGVCTLNGVCSCNTGYILDKEGKMCLPKCQGGCENGNCTAPNTCTCFAGFVKSNSTGKCGYHCQGGCGTNGVCIGPNKCVCKNGHVPKGNACVPHCPGGCKTGECVAPNTCSCKPGWSLNPVDQVCSPHCSRPCLNGQCTGPETCTCKTGYIKDIRIAEENVCVAHCPGGCVNGQCSSPNFCICNPGYIKDKTRGGNTCVQRVRREIAYNLIPKQINY